MAWMLLTYLIAAFVGAALGFFGVIRWAQVGVTDEMFDEDGWFEMTFGTIAITALGAAGGVLIVYFYGEYF